MERNPNVMSVSKLTRHAPKIGAFVLICILVIIFRNIFNHTVQEPMVVYRNENHELNNVREPLQERAEDFLQRPDSKLYLLPSKDSETNLEVPVPVVLEEVLTNDTLDTLKKVLGCKDREYLPSYQMRQDYWVLYNFVRAGHGAIGCHEAVTLAAHGDFTYMENLLPVVERWQNPVSFSLHAPGDDMDPTISSIRYARDCSGSDLIKYYVTFHIYFPINHLPKELPDVDNLFRTPYNCSDPKPYLVDPKMIYKSINNVVFPINLARNVAREPALTHFHMVSDIELIPSLNLPVSFLNMIARNEVPTNSKNPHVFVMNLFEVEENQEVPKSKAELARMIKDRVAIPFHAKICASCHNVPGRDQWLVIGDSPRMEVFRIAKRTGKYRSWEPIFIGTQSDPLYDDRLPWEGKRDKLPHAYAMCLLNYDFMVLNNAFLVHSPGIKSIVRKGTRSKQTADIISKNIKREMKLFYGNRPGCVL